MLFYNCLDLFASITMYHIKHWIKEMRRGPTVSVQRWFITVAGAQRSWRLHSSSEKVSITPVEDMLNCCPRAPVWPKYKTVNRKTDQHRTSWRKSQRIFGLGLSNAYTSIYTAYRRTKMPSLLFIPGSKACIYIYM